MRQGFKRDDLFVVVHEHFMTDTAELADIVLPATMFTEHEDFYTRGGHTRILYGPKIQEGPGETRSNHWLFKELAKRLGAKSAAFEMEDRELIDETFQKSGFGSLDQVAAEGYIERADTVADAPLPRWLRVGRWPLQIRTRLAPPPQERKAVEFVCDPSILPKFADHWETIEACDEAHPFRLATSQPAPF